MDRPDNKASLENVVLLVCLDKEVNRDHQVLEVHLDLLDKLEIGGHQAQQEQLANLEIEDHKYVKTIMKLVINYITKQSSFKLTIGYDDVKNYS